MFSNVSSNRPATNPKLPEHFLLWETLVQCEWSEQQAKQPRNDVPGCPGQRHLHLCIRIVMGLEELPVMTEIKVLLWDNFHSHRFVFCGWASTGIFERAWLSQVLNSHWFPEPAWNWSVPRHPTHLRKQKMAFLTCSSFTSLRLWGDPWRQSFVWNTGNVSTAVSARGRSVNLFTVVITHLFANKQVEVKLICGSVVDTSPASVGSNFWLLRLFPPIPTLKWASLIREKGERQRGKYVAGRGKAVGRWEGEGKEWEQPAELGVALTLPPHGPHPAGKDTPISILSIPPPFFF